MPVVLFNFPVKQEKRCINPPPLRAGDRVRVRVGLVRGVRVRVRVRVVSRVGVRVWFRVVWFRV